MADRRRIGLLLAAAAYVALAVWLGPYVIDDAFISLRYARNVVEGHGLVYNPGERVEGMTNLLWTLALVPLHALPGDAFLWMKGTSLVLAIPTAMATARLARVSELVPSNWAWVPAAWWLALPLTAVNAAEALETMLFAALLVVALSTTVEGRGATAGLLVALLTLTRPDGVLLLPIVLAYLAWQRGWRVAAWALLAALVPLVGVELWRLNYYGEWLPNTFHAKQGGTLWLFAAAVRSLIVFCAVAGAGTWLFAVPAMRRPAAWLLLAAAATRILFHLWSGGPWVGEHRFLAPMIPLALVLVAAGALTVTHRRTGLVLVSALALGPGWVLFAGGVGELRAYGHGVLVSGYRPLGEHLRELLPADGVYAASDAGAMAYYARRTSIDMLGLNDRHIARLPGQFSRDKHDPDYVLGRAPDAVVLASRSPGLGPWVGPADAAIAAHDTFKRMYRLSGRWTLTERYYLLVFTRLSADRESNSASTDARAELLLLASCPM